MYFIVLFLKTAITNCSCFLAFFISLTFPIQLYAGPIINEVYPSPNSEEKEWIEIFNPEENQLNLTDWILMDQLSSPSIIYQFENFLLKIEQRGV